MARERDRRESLNRTSRRSGLSKAGSLFRSGQGASPFASFILFFASNSCTDTHVRFVIDKAVDVVATCETLVESGFVLPYTLLDLAGYSRVQPSVSTCEYVGVVHDVLIETRTNIHPHREAHIST